MGEAITLLEETAELFRKTFSRRPALAVVAPGRSNLIGEHTDYNDGHVLPIAIDRFLAAAAANRRDRVFRLRTANLQEGYEFDADRLPAARPQWASYVMGVVAELERAGFPVTGKDILVYGNIPVGSGLSSSAALEVAVATTLERLDGFEASDAELVGACRRGDHNFVGILSGPMDQFAARACRAGHAGLLDCRTLTMTDIPLPLRLEFFGIYSGIPRSLASGAYNERQQSCREAVRVLQRCFPGVTALRDLGLDQLESCRNHLSDLAYRRATHVVTEQRRVFEMVEAFERDEVSRVGEILLAGHNSLGCNYDVSLPILDEMVVWLCRQEGILGARLTGAGFGGSLVCFARPGAADPDLLEAEFVSEFAGRTPERPELWRLKSVDGARYQRSFIP